MSTFLLINYFVFYNINIQTQNTVSSLLPIYYYYYYYYHYHYHYHYHYNYYYYYYYYYFYEDIFL